MEELHPKERRKGGEVEGVVCGRVNKSRENYATGKI